MWEIKGKMAYVRLFNFTKFTELTLLLFCKTATRLIVLFVLMIMKEQKKAKYA